MSKSFGTRIGRFWQLFIVAVLAISACTQDVSSSPADSPPSTTGTTARPTSTIESVETVVESTKPQPVDATACDVGDVAGAGAGGNWKEVSRPCDLALGSAPSVWTGTELVVWGGEIKSETEWSNAGGAYDPVLNTWRSLSPSPLPAMSGHVMIMVDSEIFICCGRNRSGAQAAAAFYDPVKDEWTEVAAPPPGENRVTGFWTGTEVLIPQRSARYDPAADEWSVLPRPPRSILPSAEVVWTGERLLVWSSSHSKDDFLLYDPVAGEWSVLPSQPVEARAWYGSMIWTGSEVIVWGDRINANGDSVGWKMNLSDRVWEPISGAPGEAASWWEGTPGSDGAVWSGDRMLVWAGELLEADGEATVILSYDPDTDGWTQLDPAPNRSYGPTLHWTGRQLLVASDPAVMMTP